MKTLYPCATRLLLLFSLMLYLPSVAAAKGGVR